VDRFREGGCLAFEPTMTMTYVNAHSAAPTFPSNSPPSSQSVIGARPPSRATVVTERRPIPQAFTNSFNSVKYSDQVCTCGVVWCGVVWWIQHWLLLARSESIPSEVVFFSI
jgi:hypothetical protein